MYLLVNTILRNTLHLQMLYRQLLDQQAAPPTINLVPQQEKRKNWKKKFLLPRNLHIPLFSQRPFHIRVYLVVFLLDHLILEMYYF